ncbi:tetratricopeptide (TPR) repeat protein [Sphingomonas zeicaulis]|uniref:tetratricopeptide repeat protein n=1 Tax=Sphingomonas zeicaulis TaxID=1632740 RepID=UPI003D193D2D
MANAQPAVSPARPSLLLMAGAAASVATLFVVRPWEPAAPPAQTMINGHRFGEAPPWKRPVQIGVPETYAAALAEIDGKRRALGDEGRLPAKTDHLDRILRLRIERAMMTGRLDDLVAAEQALTAAFARAENERLGPHWERIAFNFHVHRLSAVEPDLKSVDSIAVGPNKLERAAIDADRADLDFYRGRYDAALVTYRRIEREQGGYDNLLRLSTWFWRTGDHDKAIAYLNEAEWLVTGPAFEQRGWFELQRGLIDFDRGRWDDAAKHFAEANRRFPGDWRIESRIAKMQALKGDLPGALKRFTALAQRSDHPDMMDAVAGVYRAMGDRADSEAWAARAGAEWERRLAALPQAAWGHAIDHYLSFGDPARALELAKLNAAERPFGEALTQLAAAQLANAQPDAALATLKPVLESKWRSSLTWLVAADAQTMLGRKEEAEAARQEAVKLNPRALERNAALALIH